MTKNTTNPKNAGRKKKFREGIDGFILKDLLPRPAELQIRIFIENISREFLNKEIVKSKENEIQRRTTAKIKK